MTARVPLRERHEGSDMVLNRHEGGLSPVKVYLEREESHRFIKQ